MATTIKSTDLDFHQIKESLKTYFLDKDEFRDYNFEGSALSNLLDVLAYNTHYNALIANFALNESYLVTAQMRNSVVSLAESLGYIPDSRKSARMTVSLSFDMKDEGVSDNDTLFLNPGDLIATGELNGVTYKFSNRDTLVGENAGSQIYQFYPLNNPSGTIELYEGLPITKDFIVGKEADPIFIIPDENVDLDTALVYVYPNTKNLVNSARPTYYTNLLNATEINEASTIYVMRESPNGFYELTFGNGTTLGTVPSPNNVIRVDYLRSSGSEANGIRTLKLASTVNFRTGITSQTYSTDDNFTYSTSRTNGILTVLSRAAGGGEKETIESIRKNAPYQYAAQNRMVTALDYSSIILKNYSTYINDIKSWGGEDDPKPDYGTTFTSIVFKENLPNSTIVDISKKIEELADNLSIVSFRLKFVDPVVTYLTTTTYFQYNPSLTPQSSSNITANVNSAVSNYFATNTGKFDQNFRMSRMLNAIDESNQAILSSRANIAMYRRITPVFTLPQNYEITYPVPIKDPALSTSAVVYSNFFTIDNRLVRIRNKLNQRTRVSGNESSIIVYESKPSTTLEVIDANSNVVIPNIGSFNPTTGTVYINNITVQSISGGLEYIKIYAIPSNENSIIVSFNNIIKWDGNESVNNPVLTTSDV